MSEQDAWGGNFARDAGFSVPLLCEERDIRGIILVNLVRMMDSGALQGKVN